MSSGRQLHAEKITVYLTDEELLQLETKKLELLRKGIKVDRGRIVRAMIEVGLQREKDVNLLLKKGD